MSDLGDRRRKARIRSAEKSSERMSVRQALQAAAFTSGFEDDDSDESFNALNSFSGSTNKFPPKAGF